MDRTITSVTEIIPSPQPAPGQDQAWQEVQRACYALSGAHGPERKVAKQALLEAMQRLQKVMESRERQITSHQ